MKFIKKTKKGFTLVELVVVIAIIAILSGVSVAVYVSVTNKAKQSADSQVISQLNIQMRAQAVYGKNVTCYDAYLDAREIGFDLALMHPQYGDRYVWDEENDLFAVMKGNEVVVQDGTSALTSKANKRWIFTDSISGTEVRSQYLTSLTFDSAVNVKAGFDAGFNSVVPSVTYANTTPDYDVVIRTNGGSVTITDTNDTSHQYHYGTAANVTVATGKNCYECHAVVGAMKISQGKAIADEGAYVGIIEASSTVELKEQNGGVFVIPTNADTSKIVASEGSKLESSLKNIGFDVKHDQSGTTITPTETKKEKSYYSIGSYEQLVEFIANWNDGTFWTNDANGYKTIATVTNIKFVDNITIELVSEWTPLGTWEYPFYGTIDGMGCTIDGLKPNASSLEWSKGSSTQFNGQVFGFIAIAGGGDVNISNINFVNVDINLAAGSNVGTLIGYLPENGNFVSADKGGNYWATTETAGKKILPSYYGTNKLTVKNITTQGSVHAHNHVGGIIGKQYAIGGIVLENCVNNCNVDGDSSTGAGIIGYAKMMTGDSHFLNCVNNGTVHLADQYADWAPGGIVGWLSLGSNDCFMKDCSNTKMVSTDGKSGHFGIIGCIQSGTITLENCTTIAGTTKANVLNSGRVIEK